MGLVPSLLRSKKMRPVLFLSAMLRIQQEGDKPERGPYQEPHLAMSEASFWASNLPNCEK